ncbi:tRNA1(Val) (adenine(37)-N6)-methyltransferase [Peptoniphilus mikwangii]|uniref:tRNA1(Val) (adenine(37)-N6)-methyltransferase n=1 Tax=Peptoniphilus mikwangii TaxID=1354300 RepID=UPI000418F2D1|nr:methyltransferase [Peptoniphilus mikwangii]
MKRDYVPGTKYIIYQDENSFKYGTDSLILSSFAKVKGVCADFGSGTGILCLRLIDKATKFINFEINENAVKLLNKSIIENHLDDKIINYNIDISDVKNFVLHQSVDTIVINPPYYNSGMRAGNDTIAKARHSERLDDFVNAAKYMLKNGGTIYIVIAVERMIDLFILLRDASIEPKKIRFVKKNFNSKASLILVKAVKQAKCGFNIEQDLVLYENDKISHDFEKIYNNEEI